MAFGPISLLGGGVIVGILWAASPGAVDRSIWSDGFAREVRSSAEPLVVMIGADGAMLVESHRMNREDLRAYLRAIEPDERTITRIFVRSHPRLARAKMISVMKLIAEEGFSNVTFVPGGNSDALEKGFGPARNSDD